MRVSYRFLGLSRQDVEPITSLKHKDPQPVTSWNIDRAQDALSLKNLGSEETPLRSYIEPRPVATHRKDIGTYHAQRWYFLSDNYRRMFDELFLSKNNAYRRA